jgi:hypothetical protein
LNALNLRLRIPWAQLGWVPADPERAPGLDAGRISILVIAPWCPDCEETARELQGVPARGQSLWIAGEFAEPADTLAFVKRHGLDWPVLLGARSKDETARDAARFRHLREGAVDTRRWRGPLWIEGEIRAGWLEVDRLEWPS